MKKLLFVCTGNTCRSPIAEHIMKKYISKDEWKVFSAGISAYPGMAANEKALKVLADYDIDASKHTSQQLDTDMLESADLVLTMTISHKKYINNQYPDYADKVYTLKEYAGGSDNLDISDPFGQALTVYRETGDEINKYILKIVGNCNQFKNKAGKSEYIKNNNKRGDDNLQIAIGSDHAGIDLKKEIISMLKDMNYKITDMGTDSDESVDYPDFAYRVANGVVSGEYTRGILICGTGIGMSIAANKISGIRAALCHDVFSARVTRQHNNSNVLTLGARVVGLDLAKEIVKSWLGAEFEGGRHERRVNKIAQIEKGEYNINE